MKQILVECALPQDRADMKARKARSVRINFAESPLGWLHARRLVSDRQLAAGEALRRDYERGALSQRTVMVWDAPPPGKARRGAS